MKKKNVYRDHQRIEKRTKGKLGRSSVVRTEERDQDKTSSKHGCIMAARVLCWVELHKRFLLSLRERMR